MTQQKALLFVGLAFVAGFFMPWVSAGGFGASGFAIFDHTGWSFFRLMVLAVPVAGVLVAATSFTAPKLSAKIAIGTGLGVIGYGLWKTVETFFAITGFGLWMIIVAAVAAVAAPLFLKRA